MLQPYFEWLNNLAVSQAITESAWIYPLVQAFHLVALVVFAGALLVVDLRLLGRGFREQPIAQVAKGAHPWLIGGLVALLATGIPQLMSNALREYDSEYFWLKMYVLAVAVVFTFTVRYALTRMEDNRVSPLLAKLTAIASLALWSGVAIPARLIGLFS